MASRSDRDPIGQLVVERVAVVEKAAKLEMKPASVGARPARHPPDWTHPGDALDRLDAEPDMLALDLFRDRLVVEPAIAVADDLVAVLDEGPGEFGVTLGRLRHCQQADLATDRAEQAKRPPPADARAVFEYRLDDRAAHPRQ